MRNISEILVDKIIENLIENNSIDVKDLEIYRFGIEATMLKALHYTSYFALAVWMNKLLEFTIIFAVFYMFRRYTGGYHAQTRIGCYLFSCIIVFLSLLATNLSFNWKEMMLVSCLDLITPLKLSPVQNENRKLNAEDIACFRQRIKITTLVFLIICIITILMNGTYFINMYTIGLTMVSLLMLLGKAETIKI